MKSHSEKKIKSTSKTTGSKVSEGRAKDKKLSNDDQEANDQEEQLAMKGVKPPVISKDNPDEDIENEELSDVVADDWEKPEDDDENWDPDFDEFDIPTSGAKKISGLKKSAKDDDDEFKVDDEFKDMFNDSNFDKDDEDDY